MTSTSSFAAFVSAAGIQLDGGVGERSYRPATASELRPSYELGAGELVIDLRDVDLPAGDHHLKVGIGAGHAQVLVPEDVCVASTATIGMGGVIVFDRNGGGIDMDWSDERRAPAGTARLVIDGEVGLGLLDVRHNDDDHYDWEGRRSDRYDPDDERNNACSARVATAGSGASRG